MDQPNIVIVGAGMSGILMAIRLNQNGFNNVTLLEKGNSVGGTWRENTYPGLHCDIPSASYSFSFEPNPGWSKIMAPGPEILEYLQYVSQKYGVYNSIRFNTAVKNALFDNGVWSIETNDGDTYKADIIIMATGVLHHPFTPDFKGRNTFKGISFHSARWDHSAKIAGQRVGVIGTGSTSVQIADAVAPVSEKLTIFQRTPQWICPSPQRKFSKWEKWMANNIPGYQAIQRAFWEKSVGLVTRAILEKGWERRLINILVKRNLARVKDPQLRKKLTPDYEPMCKRLVLSESFMTRYNVPMWIWKQPLSKKLNQKESGSPTGEE